MQTRKERATYWGIVALTFFSVIATMIVYPLMGQDSSGMVVFEERFTVLGLQYRFENGWADQFSGKLHPINDTAFFIEWFKYDDTEGFLNETFYNPEASSYSIHLEFYLDTVNQTGKTTGTFYVSWFDSNGDFMEFYQTSGNLVIRDNLRIKRDWVEIIRARKYSYTVGDLT